MVETVADQLGWYRFGRDRRYGPFTMQCWRRGNKFCWISDESVDVAGDKVSLVFEDSYYQEIVAWLS